MAKSKTLDQIKADALERRDAAIALRDLSISDRLFRRQWYHLIRELTKNSLYITKEALELKRAGIKGVYTHDHFLRPELWGQVVRYNRELLDDRETFWTLSDSLRTVCLCTKEQNQTVKEKSRLEEGFARTRTVDLYQSFGFTIYSCPKNFQTAVEVPTTFHVPDFMDDLEQNVLGWARRGG
jgi:hypothetical protein